MDFIVPQFVERETRIAGPLTFRQLAYIVVAGIICIVLYFRMEQGFWFYLIAILIVGIAIAFAFIKVGNQTFPTLLKNFVVYLFSPKVYLWKSESIAFVTKTKPGKIQPIASKENTNVSRSRIENLQKRLLIKK